MAGICRGPSKKLSRGVNQEIYMKRFQLIAVLGLVAFLAMVLTANAAGGPTSVKDSKHNLNNVWAGIVPNDEVCLPCHVPHNPAEPTLRRLWNHDVDLTKAYTLFNGKTTPASGDTKYTNDLDEKSRKCLSCHDGTIAVDSFGIKGTLNASASHTLGTTADGDGSTAGYVIGGGGTLQHDHPVSLEYPELASTSLKSRADATTALGSSYAFSTGTVNGVSTKIMTCGTCHNPHGTGNKQFLRVDNTGSALCFSCHIK